MKIMENITKHRKFQSKVVQSLLEGIAKESNSVNEFNSKFEELKGLFNFEINLIENYYDETGFSLNLKMSDDTKETFRTYLV
jgi:hypothetical protein